MLLEQTNPADRVLITDAGERSMLATCRGLCAAGYEVSAVSFHGLAAGQWSRCCSERVRVTDPRADAAAFVADLRRHLQRRPAAMLVPGSDFSLFAVSQRREALNGLTQLGLPRHRVVERSFNREVLAAAAGVAGLAPAAAVPCSTADEAVKAAARLGYPVLMKSVSTVRDLGRVVAAGPNTRKIADEQELCAAVEFYGSAWLVQQMSSGRTLSVGGVMAGGRLVGVAVSEYRRTWPPSAGNVAFSVTVEPPAGLERAVEVLLREVGWHGLFELELIEDDDGAITPIDLNPRPYGSMALAIAAGVNLPGLWCDSVLGRDHVPARALSTPARAAPLTAAALASVPVRALAAVTAAVTASVAAPVAAPLATPAADPGSVATPASADAPAPAGAPPARAAPGRRYRWEDADLRHLLWQLRHGHWQAAAAALRPWPGVAHAYFRINDPLPFVVRTLALAVGKIRARLFGS